MKNKWLILPCFIFVMFFFFVPLISNVNGKTVDVYKGIVDLSNMEVTEHNLSGQWEFYWNELITPDEFKERSIPKAYTSVPHQWKDVIHKGQQLPRFGYATYRLTIIIPGNAIGKVKALSLPNIASNYKLWIDGELMLEVGKVGVSEKDSIPANSSNTISFVPYKNKIELVIQVSNFSQRKSGIWSNIVFGNDQEVINNKINYSLINGFIVGSLLIIGVYHIVMYLFRTKEKINLFFSLTCIALAGRMLFLEGNMSSLVFPNIPWEIRQKVEYIATFIAITFFNYYLHYFLDLKNRIVNLNSVVILHIFLTLFLLFTPGKINTLILPFYSIVIVLIFTNLLFQSYKKIKEIAYLFNFIAILIFLIFIVNDILYYLNFIQTVDLSPIGLILYVFFQAILLSARISKTFNQGELLKEELTKMNTSLETQVENRTKEIVQINNQLQNSLHARLDLISSISHEMRSPLTTIKSFSKGMIDGVIKDQQHEHTKTIYDETIFMERMLDDLFDLSLMELGQYKFYFEPVEPTTYFSKLFQKYNYEVTQTGLDYLYKELKTENVLIHIDPIRIEQVFINLIRNALKNTTNGSISVQISCEQEKVSVSIIDTGSGIEPHLIQNIFTKFFKGMDRKGSGIGLSICSEIIKCHHGEIFVTSELGKGSNFTFTIPTIHTLEASADNPIILEQIK